MNPEQPKPFPIKFKPYVPRRLNYILAGVFGGATLLKVIFNWPAFDHLANIETEGYPPDNWQKAPMRPSISPEELVNDPEKLAAFITTTGKLASKKSTVHYLKTTEKRHSYVHISRRYDVPDAYWTRFADATSWWPFYWMLHFFPPRGGRTSKRAPIPPLEWPEQLKYQNTLIKANESPGGPISLGLGAEVIASSPSIISSPDFVARCALQSTSDVHPLDGRVLWCHCTDKKTKQAWVVMYGEGSNKTPGMDAANNHFSGLVFSSMMGHSMEKLQIFARKNIKVIQDDGTWDPDQTSSRDELSPELRRALALVDLTDRESGTLAWLRQYLGMTVTSPPKIEAPGQVSVVDIPGGTTVKTAVVVEAIEDVDGGSALIVGTRDNLKVVKDPDGSVRLNPSGVSTDVPVTVESIDDEATDTAGITKAVQGTDSTENSTQDSTKTD